MHEYPSKDMDQDPKAKKVLHDTVDSDDEGSELDCLSEFCFVAIEEEMEIDFETSFYQLYAETIHMTKKNKELREQLQTITQEKGVLEKELRSKDEKPVRTNAKTEELQQ